MDKRLILVKSLLGDFKLTGSTQFIWLEKDLENIISDISELQMLLIFKLRPSAIQAPYKSIGLLEESLTSGSSLEIVILNFCLLISMNL